MAPGLDKECCGQQKQSSGSFPVLRIGEAAPQVLCPVWGPPIREGHGRAGVSPEKGNKAGEGSGTQILQIKNDGAGVIYTGKEEAHRRQGGVRAQAGLDDVQGLFQLC